MENEKCFEAQQHIIIQQIITLYSNFTPATLMDAVGSRDFGSSLMVNK